MSGWNDADTAELAHLAELQRTSEARIRSAVWQLRSRGCPWSVIGDLLGTSKQAAWERFHHLDDYEAD